MPPSEARLDVVLALKRIPALSRLEPELLGALAARTHVAHHRAGQPLPDGPPALHLVLEGGVRVASGGGPPREVAAGGFLGDLSVLGGDAPRLGAVARAATSTLSVDADDLLELCEEHFGLLHAVLRGVAGMGVEAGALPRGGSQRARPVSPGPLDLAARIRALAASTLFASTRVHTLGQLAQDARTRRLDPGEVAWRCDDAAPGALVVVDGELACSVGEAATRAGPGCVAGLHEALAETPRWYEARARAPVRALQLDAACVLDAMEDDPEMAVDLVATLARSLPARAGGSGA